MQLNPVDLPYCAAQPPTAEQLRYLGTGDLVYLRRGICRGTPVFVIHGADGMPVEVVGSIGSALAWIADTPFHFVAVH